MNTIRSIFLLALGTFIISGLLMGVWIGCDKKGGLGPPKAVSRLVFSSMTASPPTVQTGGQTSLITATVTDSLGQPQPGLVVQFSTTLGSITPAANTDSSGVVQATFTSGSTPGRATITARIEAEDIERIVTVQIGEISARIALEASALDIYANGAATSEITATVFDSAGNPQPGVAVAFQTTSGYLLQTTVWTDGNGEAMTTLVSAASQDDIIATVTASITSGSTAKERTTSDAVALPVGKKSKSAKGRRSEKEPEPETPSSGKIVSSAWVNVTFIGVTMNTVASPTRIAADEAEISTIAVNVKETKTSIPISNVHVFFGTDLGTIEGSAITDLSGVATASLTSGSIPGEARVRVYYGALVDTVLVSITETSHTTMVFSLNANPTALDANGASQAIITATLSDADNNNPVIGAVINFKTTLGTITAFDTTDAFGVAKATLTSARQNGTARVTASYASLSKSIEIQFKGTSLQVTANPGNLIADSTTVSTITMTLKDAANLPIFGEPCTCTSVIGVLSSDPTAEGSKLVDDTTDVNGEVILFLKSKQSGMDIIRAKAAGAEDSTEVHFTGYTFTVSPSRAEITAGGDTVTIVAELKNSLGVPEGGTTVQFATTLGIITFSDVTDSEGKARALLTSRSTSGTASVTAHAQTSEGPVSTGTTVQIRSSKPANIVLSADPKVVAVGGGKTGTATLTALVLDGRTPGNPVANAMVAFTFIANPGNGEYIDPGTAVTDVSGKAVTSFVSGTIASDFEGIEIQATVNDTVVSNIVRFTVAGAPDSVAVGYDTDSFKDNENGTYTLSVAAIVSDANGNPVIDGTWVYFSTTPNIGVVESPVQTDAGIASSHLNYPASSVGDSVTLIAESGGIEGQKSFRLPGPSGIAHSVRLDALEYSLLADGLSLTTIDALVTDVFGRPVGGAMVTFTAAMGRITLVAFTIADKTRDDYGIAHGFYTSYASFEDMTDQVCASVSGATQPDCIELDLRGISLETSAFPLSIPADGLSQATIRTVVKETVSEFPVSLGKVSFGTKMGTIVGSAVTDVSGVATSVLTSGTQVGTDTVVVSYGATLYDTVFVEFTASEVSQIVVISAEPDSIGVRGAGYNESAQLVFEVRDKRGRPISSDNPQQVRFTLRGIPLSNPPEGIVPFVHPENATTDDSARVYTTLNSGSKAGVVEVIATLDGPSGTIESTPIRISVHGGPPDSDHFSVVPRWANVPGWRYFGVIDTITAYVGDRYGNPVPTGTAVYFTTSGGIIQGSAVTNAMGAASVLLETAQPLPVMDALDPSGQYATVIQYVDRSGTKTGDGQAVVFANTVDADGNPIWAHTIVIFSGTSIISNVSPLAFNIPDGGTQAFQFTLSDLNGNPLARSLSNDLVQVRGCDAGVVSEPLKTGIQIPDTRSAGWTQFFFWLDDKEPGDNTENDPPGPDPEGCTVSIVITSQNNGDVYVSIPGQID